MSQMTPVGNKKSNEFDIEAHDSPSIAVVMAVADHAGVEPTDLQPLQTVIDTDALDSLVSGARTARAPPYGSITFEYSGYQVRVDTDGRGRLYEGPG